MQFILKNTFVFLFISFSFSYHQQNISEIKKDQKPKIVHVLFYTSSHSKAFLKCVHIKYNKKENCLAAIYIHNNSYSINMNGTAKKIHLHMKYFDLLFLLESWWCIFIFCWNFHMMTICGKKAKISFLLSYSPAYNNKIFIFISTFFINPYYPNPTSSIQQLNICALSFYIKRIEIFPCEIFTVLNTYHII